MSGKIIHTPPAQPQEHKCEGLPEKYGDTRVGSIWQCDYCKAQWRFRIGWGEGSSWPEWYKLRWYSPYKRRERTLM